MDIFLPGKLFVFRHLLQVMDGLGETRRLDVIAFACQGFGVGDRQTGAWQRSDQEFLTAGRDGDKSLG